MFRITTLCSISLSLLAISASASRRGASPSREFGALMQTRSQARSGSSPAWVDSEPFLGWPASASNAGVERGTAPQSEFEFESGTEAAAGSALALGSRGDPLGQVGSFPDILVEEENFRQAKQPDSMVDPSLHVAQLPLLDSRFLHARLRSLFGKRDDKTRCMLGRVYRPCWQT
ncbi:pro-MCH [Lampetra fluviatilis]